MALSMKKRIEIFKGSFNASSGADSLGNGRVPEDFDTHL
jgi:hypothetical protein